MKSQRHKRTRSVSLVPDQEVRERLDAAYKLAAEERRRRCPCATCRILAANAIHDRLTDRAIIVPADGPKHVFVAGVVECVLCLQPRGSDPCPGLKAPSSNDGLRVRDRRVVGAISPEAARKWGERREAALRQGTP